jgi:dTDP-4-amino-4,6-dideoxygalactose transaminase
LKALGIGQGDHVVVPGYTCFAVPSAVCFAGAHPVYADIDPGTFNVSIDTILAAVRSTKQKNVRAILIQHTYGIPAETHPIVSWARERGIYTIEDCAHVWGSRYCDPDGRWADAGTLSDASFFSSQWTKPVSTGLGGWAVTNDSTLRKNLQRFRDQECVSPTSREVALLMSQVGVREFISHPRIDWVAKRVYQALYRRGLMMGTSSVEELRGDIPNGYAKRMSSFQEWLRQRLLKNDAVVQRRRRLRITYDAALKSAGLPMLQTANTVDPVLLRYPVRIQNKERALEVARKRGIELGDWYSHPIDGPQELAVASLGYQPGACPEAERAGREVVNLPLTARTTQDTAQRATQFLREFA